MLSLSATLGDFFRTCEKDVDSLSWLMAIFASDSRHPGISVLIERQHPTR